MHVRDQNGIFIIYIYSHLSADDEKYDRYSFLFSFFWDFTIFNVASYTHTQSFYQLSDLEEKKGKST